MAFKEGIRAKLGGYMTYRVLVAPTFPDLEARVNAFITKGWVVQGGVSVYRGNDGTLISQAMLREEEPVNGTKH